jgi:hypothetical protein
MFKIIPNKKDGLCRAYRCKNNHPKKDKLCPKHRKRMQKESDPLAYTFNLLKSNANRRNKVFELSIEEFKIFCDESNYLELKGKKGSSASIDRIDPEKGYSLDNIQIMSLSNNSKKMHQDKTNKEESLPF